MTIIIATIVSLHFYFLPHFIQGDSEFAKKSKKILNFIAYAFIFIILINPMVILLTLGIISVGEFVSKNRSFINSLADTTTAIALLTSLLSGFLNAWIRDKKVKRKEDEFEAALRKIESDSELLKENKLPDEQRKRYAEFVKNYFRDMLKV